MEYTRCILRGQFILLAKQSSQPPESFILFDGCAAAGNMAGLTPRCPDTPLPQSGISLIRGENQYPSKAVIPFNCFTISVSIAKKAAIDFIPKQKKVNTTAFGNLVGFSS